MDGSSMTTAEVVEGLTRERARLDGAVNALGAGASTVSVTEEGGWTSQDVLAHLVHYAGQLCFGLGAPEKPPPYVIGVASRVTGQEWNERAVAYWSDFDLGAVRSEFERVTNVLIACAALRSDDEMNATDSIPWAGRRPLWEIIGADTFLNEWPAHAVQMERAAASPA